MNVHFRECDSRYVVDNAITHGILNVHAKIKAKASAWLIACPITPANCDSSTAMTLE